MPTTIDILTLLSLLHENAEASSATRRFRGEPVLAWTLRRVRRCPEATQILLLCWDDQLSAISPIAEAAQAQVRSQGPRRPMPLLNAISAARRWSDGWRGGPFGTSAFDAGYDATAVKVVLDESKLNAVLLVDPAAALVDPALLQSVIHQHRAKPATEFTFTPAATGLGGMLLTRPLVDRLAAAKAYPGRALHYFPDQVSREPIAQDNCAATPTLVARSAHRYTLTSQRQINAIEQATSALNGELIASDGETIIRSIMGTSGGIGRDTRLPGAPAMQAPITGSGVPQRTALQAPPREVVVELTTRRATRPIFSALSAACSTAVLLNRPDMTVDLARKLIDEMSASDDTRLTLAGVGDPLLHPDCIAIIEYAATRGIAVNVETDLLPADTDVIARLADSPADIVSIHIPALTPATYAAVMGVDAYAAALASIQAFVTRRAAAGRGTPLLIPLFTKCRQNLHEMEAWYDQWLRAVGSAVVLGPTTFAGLIADVAAADMTPPMRVPCRRLAERVTVLCDGSYVSCEQDVVGRQALGSICTDPLATVWHDKLAALRKCHANNRWNELPACASCKEWHRP